MTASDERSQARAFLNGIDAEARHRATRAQPYGELVWRSWGAGPPLVLLHGGAGSWMHWVRNVGALAYSRTVWTPDLPGMGDSDLPREGLDADSIAPIVLSGAAELLGGASFDLAGFSFGSLVAGYVAQLAPDKVRRLVLVAGTGLGVHAGPRRELRTLRGVTGQAAREEVLRHNLGAIMIHDPRCIDALAVTIQDRAAQRDRVRDRKLARTDAMLRIAPHWKCRAMGIWGEYDNARRRDVGAFDAAVDTLNLAERHVLPGAGHWVQYELPDVVNSLMARFLAAS